MQQNWLAITGNHLSTPPTLPKAPGPGLLVLPPTTERECPMGSTNHPRLYDGAIMANIKAAFHDVWDAVEAHAPIWDTVSEDELKPPSSAGSWLSLPRAQRAETF